MPRSRDEQPRPFLRQHGESSGITSLLVLKEPGEEQVLVTACQDNALKLWRMPGFSRRGILASRAGHSDIVRCLAKGPGASFFSGSISLGTMFMLEGIIGHVQGSLDFFNIRLLRPNISPLNSDFEIFYSL